MRVSATILGFGGSYVPDAIAGIHRSAWRRIAQQAADIR